MNEAAAFAVETVKRAGELARGMFGRVRIEHKESGVPFDVVTEADRALDSSIRSAIAATFPDHDVRSEESGGRCTARFCWSVDPIDGSSNFARGIPHFAISLGLLEDNIPVCGAVYNPVTDELFSFNRQLATFNGARMNCSRTKDLAGGTVLLTIGSRKENWPWGLSLYQKLLERGTRVRNLGASALDLCFLAAGRVDAVIYGGITLADIAPSVGIVRAAGGEIYMFDTGEIAALSDKPQKVIACGSAALQDAVRLLQTPVGA